MNPLKELSIGMSQGKMPTSAGMETPQETLDRAKTMTAKPITPEVSANALANPVTPVTTPAPVTPPALPGTGTIDAVRSETDNIIAAQTEEAKRLQDLRNQYSALSDQGSLQDLFNAQQSQYQIPENLKALKDINLQLADMQTASDLTKTRIEGAAGQTLGQGQREVTQEDREQAVRSAGLAARAAVLQGNIETASALVNQAVNIAYQDRQLKNQNLINQINDLSGTVDAQTQQLLDQEKRKYEADQAAIKEVKDAVNAAMVSGAASAQEVAQLTDPNTTDEQRLALAQSIVGRGAGEMRDLTMQEKMLGMEADRASIANTYSAMADRNKRFELDLMKFEQASVDAVREAQAQAATEEEAKRIENTAKGDKALSMLTSINELSTHPGFSASVGPNPLARVNYSLLGLGVFNEMATGEKSAFKSDVDRLANTLTLENMDLLKGPATDKDVEIVAASMSRLKNMDVTEKSYMEELGRLQAAAQRIVDEVGVTPEQLQYYGLADTGTIQEADAVWGDPDVTSPQDMEISFNLD